LPWPWHHGHDTDAHDTDAHDPDAHDPDAHDEELDVAIDERLLDILVCPACHGKVEHKERRNLMVCTACGLRYPVRDGIPVMLVDEATKGRPG
jgi:uncharacterized protein